MAPADAPYTFCIIFLNLAFLNLRIYPHFTYETSIRIRFASRFSIEGNFLHVPARVVSLALFKVMNVACHTAWLSPHILCSSFASVRSDCYAFSLC
jgi:hypothetical protein